MFLVIVEFSSALPILQTIDILLTEIVVISKSRAFLSYILHWRVGEQGRQVGCVCNVDEVCPDDGLEELVPS